MSETSKPSSRRDFLKQATVVGAGLFAGSAYGLEARQPSAANEFDFYGKHQQGIVSGSLKHIYFMVLDLHTTDVAKIREMFQIWTAYSRNLIAGNNVKPYSTNAYVPPVDTGEADSLAHHGLSLTFGVSPDFFRKLNIEQLKPQEFVDLPHFPHDQLQANYTGGDICIQACTDDPQVAFHAVRNLVRVARANITMRWSQAGFNSFKPGETPRNLFGFKDGTGNPTGDELSKTVWCEGENWLKNGTYLVVRRVQMHLETWDRTNLAGQEETFGRHRDTGAPIGMKQEFDTADLEKKNEKGAPLIPEISHLHLAKKTGVKILRRSFSYASGVDPKTGQFDAGLLFISFQQDPQQFIAIQNSLGNIDKMNEYITNIGSGIFACFAGVKDERDYLGKALFDAI